MCEEKNIQSIENDKMTKFVKEMEAEDELAKYLKKLEEKEKNDFEEQE